LYDVTYFFFPLIAVVFLYLDLRSVDKAAVNMVWSTRKEVPEGLDLPGLHP